MVLLLVILFLSLYIYLRLGIIYEDRMDRDWVDHQEVKGEDLGEGITGEEEEDQGLGLGHLDRVDRVLSGQLDLGSVVVRYLIRAL